MEYCFHDNFDMIAASLAVDIIAQSDVTLFKERLVYCMCVAPACIMWLWYFMEEWSFHMNILSTLYIRVVIKSLRL